MHSWNINNCSGSVPRPNAFSQQNTKMPPNHESDQEARILQAIEAIHINKSPSIRAAARTYNVYYTTLARRLRRQPIR